MAQVTETREEGWDSFLYHPGVQWPNSVRQGHHEVQDRGPTAGNERKEDRKVGTGTGDAV